MPKRQIITSTPVKEPLRKFPRRLNTSTEILEEFEKLLAEGNESGSEHDIGSENEFSDHDNTVEFEDVVGDNGDDDAAAPSRRTARVLSWTDVEHFRPEVFDFDRTESGIQSDFPVIDEDAKEIEYFEAYFDEEIVGYMCEQTNLYHAYASSSRETPTPTPSTSGAPTPTHSPSTSREPTPTPSPSTSRASTPAPTHRKMPTPAATPSPSTSRAPTPTPTPREMPTPTATPSPSTSRTPIPTGSAGRAKMRKWVNVTVKDMYTFLALLMLMVHVKKAVLKEYWISNEDITSTPIFSKYMPRDRFVEILRYLHFVDNRMIDDNRLPASDRLRKIRKFFS